MNEDRRKEKRSRILDAAGELFLEKGVENTKIIDIAKAAGVAKGTVYEYFESKEVIVVEWVKGIFGEFQENMSSIVSSGECFRQKLREYFDCCFEQISHVMLKSKVIFGSGKYKGYRPHPSCEGFEHKDLFDKSKLMPGGLHSLIMENARFEVGILKKLIDDAAENGEIRSDVDRNFIASYILSMIPFMGLVRQKNEFNDMMLKWMGLSGLEIDSGRLVDMLLDGMSVNSK